MDRWIVWTGKYWQFDHGEQLGRMAKRVVSSVYAEAATAPEEMQDKLGAWASQSGFDARIKGMINQAKSLEGITVLPDELDSDPWLLNVNNGTVNLMTGELRPHNQDDLITRIIPINYNPDAESPLWDDTLDQTCSHDDNLKQFIKRAAGYSATGSTKDMATFLTQGSGFNGKSTLLGVIHDVLGPYAHEVDPRVFMVSRNDRTGPNEDIADLYRKRFVIGAEINEQMRLSVSLVKRLTGGEQLRFERKFEHGFNFKPELKLWLMSNHEPMIADSTNSIWGRIKKIPFNHFFGPDERNPNLRQQLVTEHGEAVLAWLIHGVMEWCEFGLSEPVIVKDATEEYRKSQDVLREFLAEKCNIEPNATVLGHDLYRCYQNWCSVAGEKRELGKITFGKLLREKGLTTFSGTGNAQFWKGIELTEGVVS
jgi:putative DNA primase/helicase